MKKIISTTVLCLVLSLICTVCFAIGATVGVDYDADSKVVSLSGRAYGYATIRITPFSDEPGSYSESNLPTDILQFASNGSFSQKLFMPASAENGKYLVYLNDDDSDADVTFIYYDKQEADEIVADNVNKASTKSGFVSAASDNAYALGIDTEDEDYSEDVLGLMYELDVTYEDSSEFYDHYNYCKAICSLYGKDSDEVLSKLKAYESVLGIDFDKDYKNNKNLTDDAKALLLNSIASLDYADEIDSAEEVTGEKGFKAIWLARSALSSLASTESWKDMKEIYTSTYSFLKNNVVNKNSSYKSSSASTVFSNLAKLTFDSVEDLKDNFDQAVKKSKKPESDSGSGSGSGSGSSGSFSAPSAGAPTIYDEIPGVDKLVETRLSVPLLSDSDATYTDVSASDWFYTPVAKLGASGIISGDPDGSFRPDDNITRAEFAKLIVSAFDVKGERKSFADVSETSWYEPYVSVAAGVGILQGYDGKFNPDNFITRQDAAVIIYRTADLLGIQYSGFAQPTDINDASVYAWTAIGSLYDKGIISGMGDGSFAPLSNITRAQAAQLLYTTITDMQTRK